MNRDRYQALTEGDMSFLARGIGMFSAGLDSGGDFGHPGDDTGRVVAAAFHKFGPTEAAQVLEKFMHGYNTTRKAQGQAPVNLEGVKQSAPLALSVSLERDEIQQILTQL